MHSRFEHSLGVMHMATQLYDPVVHRSLPELEKKFGFNNAGRERTGNLSASLHCCMTWGMDRFHMPWKILAPVVPGNSD